MLEAGYVDLFDQIFQREFGKGIAESSLTMLMRMARRARALTSEKRWKRLKKAEEERYRKYQKEHPDSKDTYRKIYDSEGYLVKEKWIEEQKSIMECMGFPEEGWEELCRFVKKYPELSAEDLARRVIRESEYKYI